ncbi:MAG: hypothetical protein R2823_02220 [Acidimicrobiia bacterium]
METMERTATPIERDIVVVEGSDARSYLQTQLTQDVEALDLGQSAWSFILDPKSSIEALVRVTRIGHDRLTLDIEPGHGDAVRKRLDGMLFRTDVRFSQTRWPGVAWRGHRVGDYSARAPIVSRCTIGGIEGVDIVGPDVEAPVGVPAVDLEELRIETGWPAMGAELVEGITPAMTGLVAATVSFDKGCYTGQELVARAHRHGAAPTRRLVHITAEPGTVTAGSELTVDGDPAGSVTSMLPSGKGLGYLARRFEVPTRAMCGATTVEITAIES